MTRVCVQVSSAAVYLYFTLALVGRSQYLLQDGEADDNSGTSSYAVVAVAVAVAVVAVAVVVVAVVWLHLANRDRGGDSSHRVSLDAWMLQFTSHF